MAHLHKKMKKGKPYYYIREIARVNGKPTVVSQVYLGSLERMLKMASGKKDEYIKVQSQEFGALWLANLIDQEIDLVTMIDSVIPKGDCYPRLRMDPSVWNLLDPPKLHEFRMETEESTGN